MGIYDRDYARASGGGARPRPAAFTFVQWLVIANVLVFVLDALVWSGGFLLPVHMGDRFIPGVDPAQTRLLIAPLPSSPPPGGAAVLPIIDGATQMRVGERHYRWMPPLQAWGHFSTAKGFFRLEVWRLVTFQFLHADTTHLLFNMIGLWFFGPVVEQYLRSRKRFAAFYLVCGISGALVYLALNLAGTVFGLPLPGVLRVDIYTPLIGASAGVFGVLLAVARIAGNAQMLLFFVLPMKVRHGALLMLGLALWNLLRAGANAGGDAAHIGGAIAGYFFITNVHLLRDFFDILGPGGRAGAAGRRAHRAGGGPLSDGAVDAVLEKVRQRGMHSLSEGEKELLRRATMERRSQP